MVRDERDERGENCAMGTERWAIHMHKEYFKFSCAHFLIFPDGSRNGCTVTTTMWMPKSRASSPIADSSSISSS